MVKFVFSSISSVENPPLEVPIVNGETIRQCVTSVLLELEIDTARVEEFIVIHNAQYVDPTMWEFTTLKCEDTLIIAPRLANSDTMASIVRIGLIVAGTYFLTPAFAGAGAGIFAPTLASVTSFLAVNALIPPPLPEGLKSGSSSVSDSQAFSISGQSNTVKKYGVVPKVYGEHRIFPPVVATPYVSLVADVNNGTTNQYLTAIYDLGLGPAFVEDIKIGETPIQSFDDAFYRIIDPNKPTTSEGVWDDQSFNQFLYYQGRIEQDQSAYSLNENQVGGGPEENYRVVRNFPQNPNNLQQNLLLYFVNPQGLYAYNSTGSIGTRSIEVEIEFAPVGTEDWLPYNDITYTQDILKAGGDSSYNNGTTVNQPYVNSGGLYPSSNYSIVYQSKWNVTSTSGSSTTQLQYRYYGYNIFNLNVRLPTGIPVGNDIFVDGQRMGRVTSSFVVGNGLSQYTIDPAGKNYFVFYKTAWSRTVSSSGSISPETFVGQSGQPVIKSRREILKRFKISGDTTNAFYSTVSFTPRNPGNYKVRITRISSSSSSTSSIQDALTLTNVAARYSEKAIDTDKRHVFLELRIKATNQLNGQIQNLSANVTSALDVFDGTSWSKQLTNNPAWVYADILTGQVNKRAISKSRLDTDSLLEWADFCDEVPDAPPSGPVYTQPRFTCNFVLDYESTVQQVLNQVANAAQASFNIIDGKYGVLVDRRKDTPVQIFTPRNTISFSSTRTYSSRPDGLKVKFIDPSSTWKVQDITVYEEGFNTTTATTFEDVVAFACTNPEQAYRYGRYTLAQNKLRQERITIEVDFEYLVCSRGDYVQFTQDVMKVGGSPARVKSVSGNRVTIDDAIETNNLLSYSYVVRTVDGIVQDTLTVVNSDTFDLDGTIPSVGDLIVIGESSTVVFDCIVLSITPNDDLTATLVLVEKADAIYDAESSDTIPEYSPSLSLTADADFEAPGEVEELLVADNNYICDGSDIRYYVLLDWEPPNNAAVELYEVYADEGRGYNLVTTTKETLYSYTVNKNSLNVEHKFKILAVSATGKKKNLGEVGSVTATPLVKLAKPSNVASLHIDITNQVLQFVWEAIEDCDCAGYRIRYSPNSSDVWESSVPLLTVDRNTTSATTQARTGIYLIKAFDTTGNESATEVSAITTIPELFDLNIIEETNDFPTLTGSKDRVEASGGELKLRNTVVGGVATSEYYSEGYYYYQDLLDLGDIYTVRLQSLIRAEGFTQEDSMSNWITLSSVVALANSQSGEWDVKTQYRTTNQLNVISDWVTLDSIAILNEGASEIYTPWRDFIMGDATGRIFQFRLKLISNKLSVTPRVFDGVIRADMPDRIDRYDNITIPDTGYSLTYTYPFKGPGSSPNIQVSISNSESGDYFVLSNKDLEGFDIQVFDRDDNAVAREIDVVAVGYGRRTLAII